MKISQEPCGKQIRIQRVWPEILHVQQVMPELRVLDATPKSWGAVGVTGLYRNARAKDPSSVFEIQIYHPNPPPGPECCLLEMQTFRKLPLQSLSWEKGLTWWAPCFSLHHGLLSRQASNPGGLVPWMNPLPTPHCLALCRPRPFISGKLSPIHAGPSG